MPDPRLRAGAVDSMRGGKPDRSGRELRFLRQIGVLRFRRALMLWEAFFHRKDGMRHANYHLRGSSFGDIDGYREYVLYHVFLHLTGILAVGLYFGCRFFVFPASGFLFISDCLMAPLGVLHLYCLLLQRYTVLLLRRYREQYARCLGIRTDALREAVSRAYAGYDRSVPEADRRTLTGIFEKIRAGRDAVLGEEEGKTLKRVSACLAEAGTKRSPGAARETSGRPFHTSRPDLPDSPARADDPERIRWPYGASERRAAWCTEKIWRKKSVLLAPCAVLCACPEAEEAYRGLIAEGKAFAVLEAAAACLNEITEETAGGHGGFQREEKTV